MWELLKRTEPSRDYTRLCVGDFNEIMWSTEKKILGNMRFTNNMGAYRQIMMDLKMQDLGFRGYKST